MNIIQCFQKKLDKRDLGWLATLFGTALGAGVLYLPVEAAKLENIITVTILLVFALPVVWLAHHNLTIFCLSYDKSDTGLTSIIREKFSSKMGGVISAVYFLSVFPILLLYGIGLTNVVNEMLFQFFQLEAPNRFLTSFIILIIMHMIIFKGEKWIFISAQLLVVPLALIIVFCTFYFIPYWHWPEEIKLVVHGKSWIVYFISVFPLIVFSFNHSPACSSFAQSYRLYYGSNQSQLRREKIDRILRVNIILLAFTILPFVFSCVLSMTHGDLHYAISKNIPAPLAISALKTNVWIPSIISIITLLAITSSFFGVYMGAIESTIGFLVWGKKAFIKNSKYEVSSKSTMIIYVVIFIITWLIASFDYSVIHIIQFFVAPALSILLFLMPIYGKYRFAEYKKERNIFFDSIIVLVGLLILYGSILGLIEDLTSFFNKNFV